MSSFNAYFSAVAAFFSIWVFCLLQIIPFFVAFIVGATLTAGAPGAPGRVKEALLLSLASFAGFTFIFASMGMTTTAISKAIFGVLSLGNQIGGVVIGVIGLYLVGVLTLEDGGSVRRAAIRYASALLFGAAVGLAYRPCVTPALTEIYKVASNPSSAWHGAVLLVMYSTGIATVITGGGLAVSWAVAKAASRPLENAAKKLCGAVLLVIAGLILSGNMTAYKSFLVGRFVPDAPAVDPAMRRD